MQDALKFVYEHLRINKSALLLSLFTCWLLAACEKPPAQSSGTKQHLIVSTVSNQALIAAFANKQSQVQVEGSGTITKLLADDNKGARHQKFLVTVAPDQTLLFAHNIDLAPRVESLAVGEKIGFKGEYIYNPKGGIVHWTHHDPAGQHPPGWIQYKGKVYQ